MTQEQFESSLEQHDDDLIADDDDGEDVAANDFGDDDPSSVPLEADSQVHQLAKNVSQHPQIENRRLVHAQDAGSACLSATMDL